MARRPDTDRYVDFQSFALWRMHSKVEDFQDILNEHDRGVFGRSAPLVDEILTDDRISGVAETRQAAVKAAPRTVEASSELATMQMRADEIGGKDKQKGILDTIVTDDTLGELLQWGWFLGFAYAQIVWLREPRRWTPYLELWHPRWVRWDQAKRGFIVQTENRGEVLLPRPDQNPRGDGKWFVWLPYGIQGWKRGLIRSLALKYLSRQWNERDWDRHNERQGMAVIKGKFPQNASEDDKQAFMMSLENIGSEACVSLPFGVNQAGEATAGFDIEAMEFEAKTYEAMDKRKAVLDNDIAIRIAGNNLPTEVKDAGSFAATAAQKLIRLDKAIADARIGPALRAQVLTWHAEFNYGDPEQAPWVYFNVEPPDDELGEAQALKTLGDAVTALKTAEPRVDQIAILEEHGVPLMSEEELVAELEEKAARPVLQLPGVKPGEEKGDEEDDGAGEGEEDAGHEEEKPAPIPEEPGA